MEKKSNWKSWDKVHICQSDDKKYELMRDEYGYLYGRGENIFGQLGIGAVDENV
jgi:hypothetical protein